MAKTGGKQSNPRELSIAIPCSSVLDAFATTKVDSASSPEDKIGMRIHSIDYFVTHITTGMLAALAASGDAVKFGFSFLSSQPAGGFVPQSPGVIDYKGLTRIDTGAAANGHFVSDPFTRTNMHDRHPDGFLIHPASLYYWYYTTNALAGNFYIYAKMWYTIEDITQDVWDDMWKAIFVTQAG